MMARVLLCSHLLLHRCGFPGWFWFWQQPDLSLPQREHPVMETFLELQPGAPPPLWSIEEKRKGQQADTGGCVFV